MHKYNYRDGLDTGRICLEMSLKPFIFLDDEYIESVCRRLFEDWKPLIKKASSVAVMLWTADGSEILEYDGDLSKEFNWCNLIGIGNPRKEPKDEIEFHMPHVRSVPYNENKHSFTYGDLKRVITALKKVGKELTGKEISVVETFDPGPEFAKSDFKFNRHKELAVGSIMGNNMWIHCASKLHAENKKYAAFPDGIPEGTPFGTFLGKQFMALKNDIGFDRIWLSNGFGFSLQSWNCYGEVFDGERFDFSGAKAVRESINEFWRTFTAETGDMVIETRGSNLSMAMDVSAHGCPVDDIYSYNMIAPPNSPWAALNSRFGLELCGYLSRIATLPDNGFLFRYYTHDPWWANSPWFDRYGRCPHDIYLPLALARLDENGKVTRPYGINLLSCDDSFGEMPEKCANEVIPHLLSAMNDYPESCGPVTWLYPFKTYCDIGLRDGKPDRIFMDDWFIEAALDLGFPMSSVISDENFNNVDASQFKNTVIFTAVPEEGSLLESCVFKALENGIKILLYGSCAHASHKLYDLLGIKKTEPIEGKFTIDKSIIFDSFEKDDLASSFNHISLYSGGGLCESVKDSEKVISTVKSANGEERAYLALGKNIAWVRGSFPHDPNKKGSLPEIIPANEAFPVASLMRSALALLGFKLSFSAYSAGDALPVTVVSDSKESMFLTTFAKNMNVKMIMSTPLGAPVCTGLDAIVENDTSEMIMPKWQHEELQIFIKQKERSHIITRHEINGPYLRCDKRLSVSGLVDARVYVRLPEPFAHAEYAKSGVWPWFKYSSPMKYTDDGCFAYADGLTGCYDFSFQTKDTREEYIEKGFVHDDETFWENKN